MLDRVIRVLLVDDHPALRVGLRVLLEQGPVEVVGEAGDGPEALAQIAALQPDVAMLDCQLPGMTGIEVAAEVQRRGLPVRILAFSAYNDGQYVRGMLAAGAVGYLLKEEAPEAVVAAVQAVAEGQTWFSPSIATLVVAWASGQRVGLERLTEWEMEVLRLLVDGKTDRQIGQELGIAERTVRRHLRSIYDKLGVNTRVAAVAQAARRL